MEKASLFLYNDTQTGVISYYIKIASKLALEFASQILPNTMLAGALSYYIKIASKLALEKAPLFLHNDTQTGVISYYTQKTDLPSLDLHLIRKIGFFTQDSLPKVRF